MFAFTCPSCGFRMSLDDQYAGQKGRCPNCQTVVDVVADTRAVEQAAPSPGRARADVGGGSLWPICVAAVGTILFYVLIAWPAERTYFGALFLKRGPTPYVMTFMFFWALGIIATRALALRRQWRPVRLELDLLPPQVGLQITPGNVDQFISSLDMLAPKVRRTLLVQRIRGALEHFKGRPNAQEVYAYLSSQADIDGNRVTSSRLLLRTLIWGLPIMGFIGTVLGIGQAVAGLSGAFSTGGGDVGTALAQVTGGLSTAFDTTLVALILAIILMFPTQSLARAEEMLLAGIEQFGNESLVRRIAGDTRDDPIAGIAQAIARPLAEHAQAMDRWITSVKQIGPTVATSLRENVQPIQDELVRGHQQALERIAAASHSSVESVAAYAATQAQRPPSASPLPTEGGPLPPTGGLTGPEPGSRRRGLLARLFGE